MMDEADGTRAGRVDSYGEQPAAAAGGGNLFEETPADGFEQGQFLSSSGGGGAGGDETFMVEPTDVSVSANASAPPAPTRAPPGYRQPYGQQPMGGDTFLALPTDIQVQHPQGPGGGAAPIMEEEEEEEEDSQYKNQYQSEPQQQRQGGGGGGGWGAVSLGADTSGGGVGTGEVAGDDGIMEGQCLARISTRTILIKKWKPCFWVLENKTLLLYREKDDFLYNPRGTRVKKRADLTHTMRVSPITDKDYRGQGHLFYFTLEQLMDFGPATVAKFASEQPSDIQGLHTALTNIIGRKKQLRQKYVSDTVAEQKRREDQFNVPGAVPAYAAGGGGGGGGEGGYADMGGSGGS